MYVWQMNIKKVSVREVEDQNVAKEACGSHLDGQYGC